MSSFNRVILVGNLTRDPQIKNLPSGTMVAEFGMATNRKWNDKQSGQAKEEVAFVDCSAFGKAAEVITQYCRKGKSLLVEGRLKYDSWEDKTSGTKRSKLTVVVENFQFLGGPDKDGEGDGGQRQERRQPRREPGRAESPFGQPAPTLEEADIPF